MKQTLLILTAAVTMSLTCQAQAEKNELTSALGSKLLNIQCNSYVEKQKAWQMAKLTMNSTKAAKIKTEVCSCASEEAAKNVTAQQMLDLANPSSRNQTIIDLLIPTVKACYAKLGNSLF